MLTQKKFLSNFFKIIKKYFINEIYFNDNNKILIQNLYESKFINISEAINDLLTLYYYLWNKVKTKDDNDDNIISTLKMYWTNIGKKRKIFYQNFQIRS